MATTLLTIPGMTYGGCGRTVQAVLEAEAGVRAVQVDPRSQTVKLDDDDQQLGLHQVRDILTQRGYPVDKAYETETRVGPSGHSLPGAPDGTERSEQ